MRSVHVVLLALVPRAPPGRSAARTGRLHWPVSLVGGLPTKYLTLCRVLRTHAVYVLNPVPTDFPVHLLPATTTTAPPSTPRPLRFFESSTPAAARLPGPSPSTKGHLRTLRDRGGRPLSRASRQRAAEAHTAAATRQRWAKGRGRPHGSFPQRRGRFMKKREEKRRRPSFFPVGLVSS